MNIISPIAIFLFSFILCNLATANSGASQSKVISLDATVNQLVDGQRRVLSQVVKYCATLKRTGEASIEQDLKSYLDAFREGSKAGLAEIAATDQNFLGREPAYKGKDFEVMDKQGQLLVDKAKTAPVKECAKFSAFFNSATATAFRNDILRNHNDYQARRANHCAQRPTPKGCE
ncbi:hypothetical protein [Marinobacter confluentis]|uniref:Uncharacterized protein n=1 Tax=Marinobacter confluentis TaxID=1697557 RepID=A0A4Z1CC92_9GAMM|nr:hypothetical protein [Marinobacter confluentis]TGN41693.1 hypothetical protein E5Q11_03975 [Marinobacter confluentis]